MNRTTYFLNAVGAPVVQEERLSRRPSGNAQQRNKQLRNGWQPTWVKTGQLCAVTLPPMGTLPAPPEIAAAMEIADYASGSVEFERAMRVGIQQQEEQQFCLESGLL